jgi:kynurenine formamidase
MCHSTRAKTKASNAVWVSRSNGQSLTHSNHLGTHLDGEIHLFTAGKDIAAFGDAYNPAHVERINQLTRQF